MIRMTDDAWEEVKGHIPRGLAERIETDDRLRGCKLPKIRAFRLTDLGELPVDAEQLSEHWCLAPDFDPESSGVGLAGVVFHRKYRSVIHTPTGYGILSSVTRQKALRFWETVKSLDIHHDSVEGLRKSGGIDQLREAVYQFESGQEG